MERLLQFILDTIYGIVTILCFLFVTLLAVTLTITIVVLALGVIFLALDAGPWGILVALIVVPFAIWLIIGTWVAFFSSVSSCYKINDDVPNINLNFLTDPNIPGVQNLIGLIRTCEDAQAVLAAVNASKQSIEAQLEEARTEFANTVRQLAVAVSLLVGALISMTININPIASITAFSGAVVAVSIATARMIAAGLRVNALQAALVAINTTLTEANALVSRLCSQNETDIGIPNVEVISL